MDNWGNESRREVRLSPADLGTLRVCPGFPMGVGLDETSVREAEGKQPVKTYEMA